MYFLPNETILAGVPPTTLQTWLTNAQNAYAALCTGSAVVISVGYDGKNVTYQQADTARLEAFINLIQRQLGLNRGRRALRPYFI